jgi:polygalacturonase
LLAASQFFRATMSGTIKDLKIINSPRQVFSIGNKSKLVIDGVTIDNRAGKPLGHNSCVARRVSLDSISLR